jgi:hypothetical protein
MPESSFLMPALAPLAYVVGIDIGMESCMMCALTMEKRQVIKPSPFANTAEGFISLFERLEHLGAALDQILVGLEATSRDARKSLSCTPQARVPRVSVTSSSDACLCPSLEACEPKRIKWMPRPLRVRSWVVKPASVMYQRSKSQPIGNWCACSSSESR